MSGRVALVTGAAGGMGSVIAARLGAIGARVAMVDVNADRLRLVAKDLANAGITAEPFPADVRSSAEVDDVVAQAENVLAPSTISSTRPACSGWARPAN